MTNWNGIWPENGPIVIGMLHLPPLPGAPRFAGRGVDVVTPMLTDAERLLAGGVHGLMLENFGDTPFYPERVPAETVAEMTRIAGQIRDRFDLPLGINVLRNDGRSALAVAAAVGAAFIRVNVLGGARVADQGVLRGCAHDLLRDRVRLDAAHIRIFADVNVKHSAALGHGRPLGDEVRDLVQRGGADALIVSGPRTGASVEQGELALVRESAAGTPVLVGSGVTRDNIAGLRGHADGFIVGTAFKVDGDVHQPVDPRRVRELLAEVQA